jgi:hypothetical protein
MADAEKRLEFLAKAKNADEIAARFSGGFCLKSWREIAREYRDLAHGLDGASELAGHSKVQQPSQVAANDDQQSPPQTEQSNSVG